MPTTRAISRSYLVVRCRKAEGAALFRPTSSPADVFQREAGLQRHLIVLHLAVLDVAARLGDLEPAQMPQGARGAGDGALHGILDARLRRADELDDLVDMIMHGVLHPAGGGNCQSR